MSTADVRALEVARCWETALAADARAFPAYARATGTVPTYFPINHRDPLRFKPKPVVPPIPQSPTNGLKLTY